MTRQHDDSSTSSFRALSDESESSSSASQTEPSSGSSSYASRTERRRDRSSRRGRRPFARVATHLTSAEYQDFLADCDELRDEIDNLLEPSRLFLWTLPLLAFCLTVALLFLSVMMGGFFVFPRRYYHGESSASSGQIFYRLLQLCPLVAVGLLLVGLVLRQRAHNHIRNLVHDFWQQQAQRHGRRVPRRVWKYYQKQTLPSWKYLPNGGFMDDVAGESFDHHHRHHPYNGHHHHSTAMHLHHVDIAMQHSHMATDAAIHHHHHVPS